MSLIICEEGFGIATHAKSLKAFMDRHSFSDGHEFRVYKSQAAFRDGFDYVSYYSEGGKLKKSNAQPIPEINREFAGWML